MSGAVVGIVLGATAVVAVALVPLSRWIAFRFGVLDLPGPRKVHAQPTPRLGGIAVFGALVLVVGGGMMLSRQPDLPWPGPLTSAAPYLRDAHRVEGRVLGLLAGMSVVFVVGLLDDVLGARFPWGVKALGQVLAASVLVGSGVTTTILPWDAANVLLTVGWVVGITNAFNFLDNMDGLSAGVASVAGVVLLLNAWALGEYFVCLLLAAFLGSLLGFLVYNVHPASVFLGDCGSLVIGFAMASITLIERYVSHASSTLFPVLMPLVALAVPLIDTATVVVIRLREGRPVYVGDKRHLSHRLVALGLSPRQAVGTLWLMTFCLGAGVIPLADASPARSGLILLQTLGFVGVILVLMSVRPRPVDP